MSSTIFAYFLEAGRVKFPVSFEYLARRFVTVTLVGATRQQLTLNVDYRFTSKMEIETTVNWLPGEFTTLEIRRVTSATDRLVNFTDGSILRSQDLNIAQIQAIHIAEEGRDVAENSLLSSGLSWNALGLPIRNVGYPSLPTDAANGQYVLDNLRTALRVVPSETITEIPSDRANKVLAFDSNRQPIAIIPSAGSSMELELALLDQTKGSEKVGHLRKKPSVTLNTVGKFLGMMSVNMMEHSGLVTYRPSQDMGTWDWAPALKEAILQAQFLGIQKVTMPKGVYGTSPIYFDEASTVLRDVHIDFNGSTFNCIAPRTKGTRYDWRWGIFTFHGTDVGAYQDVVTSEVLTELNNVWPVLDSSKFDKGDFITVEVDPEAVKYATKTVWRQFQITSINSPTSIGLSYMRAADIPQGTTIRFQKVNPMRNVVVSNLVLVYDRPFTAGDAQSQLEASSGVVFMKADGCKALNVEYRRNPKQAVHFEYTTNCSAEHIRMYDPIESNSGGYCVQFEKSDQFLVFMCRASKDRHLFDATASSNGRVIQCSGLDTLNSSFTTHGTHEHNIEYIQCVGHFQLAGSGVDFGQTSFKITLKGHVGSILNARETVYDLTLDGCTFTSVSNINLDGLRIVNSAFLNDVRITKVSDKSKRASVADTTTFKVGANFFNLTLPGLLRMESCTLPEMLNGSILGIGSLILQDCKCINTGSSAVPLNITLPRFEVRGGEWKGLPIMVSDVTADQVVILDGCEIDIMNRPVSLSLVQTTKTSGNLSLEFKPRVSRTTGRHLTANTAGASTAISKISIRDTELIGGTVQVQAGVLTGGYLMRNGVVYNKCTPTFPPNASNIGAGTEITLT